MSYEYNFPIDFFVRVMTGNFFDGTLKVEIYDKKEDGNKIVHMEKKGLLYLNEEERTLEGLAKKLNDEKTWSKHY